MKYSIDALNYANKIIDKRRSDAISAFEKNKELAYKSVPKIRQIDSLLSSSGIEISRLIVSKGADITESISKMREKNQKLIQEKQSLLTENGFDKDFLSIPYHCKKCNDTGYVDALPCSCLTSILNEYITKEAIKKSSQIEASFENFDLKYYPESVNDIPCKQIMTQIFDNCKEYAEDFSKSSPNLLFFGGTGIGKTHISLAISKVVSKKGYNVIYLSAPDLFSALEKERFNQESVPENMQNMLGCDLLIIDDLGSEFTTSFTISALYNIVNTRLNMSVPTIITANLSPSEISKRYTERIASRLIGCYEHLHFVGKDIRIQKKKEN